MNQQGLNKCWIDGKGAINGWCGIPSTVTAEIMSLQKFDSINSKPNLEDQKFETACTSRH